LDKTLYRISIALTVIGLAVSIYMWIYKLTDNSTMCLGSGDCSIVNASPYSKVGRFPVAAIGVAGYAAILVLLFLERRPGFFSENATLLIFGLSLTGFLFNLYLIYVEIYIIRAFCPFCITSQVAMNLIFILSIIRLVRQPSLH
jgi:uncharacterized membrane protein